MLGVTEGWVKFLSYGVLFVIEIIDDGGRGG